MERNEGAEVGDVAREGWRGETGGLASGLGEFAAGKVRREEDDYNRVRDTPANLGERNGGGGDLRR